MHVFRKLTSWILQEINVENMNVELVAQMFKNYQSNVLFHLEGSSTPWSSKGRIIRHKTNGS